MNLLPVLPPLVAIVITFRTKKLIPALAAGLITGSLLQSRSILGGLAAVVGYVTGVLSEKGSAYALSLLIIYGSLSEIISMSGGIAGFREWIEKRVRSEKGLLIWSWFLSVPTFFNSSFHFISVGSAARWRKSCRPWPRKWQGYLTAGISSRRCLTPSPES